jgi:hypothetical protein
MSDTPIETTCTILPPTALLSVVALAMHHGTRGNMCSMSSSWCCYCHVVHIQLRASFNTWTEKTTISIARMYAIPLRYRLLSLGCWAIILTVYNYLRLTLDRCNSYVIWWVVLWTIIKYLQQSKYVSPDRKNISNCSTNCSTFRLGIFCFVVSVSSKN